MRNIVSFNIVTAVLVCAASISGAQVTAKQPLQDTVPLVAALRAAREIASQLGINTFRFDQRDATAGVAFEDWTKTPMTAEALLPIARRALRLYVSGNARAAAADTLYAIFADGQPRCVKLRWFRSSLLETPDEVTMTKVGVVCT